MGGVESSRTPSSTATSANTNSSGSSENAPAIAGSVVGGIAGLGFLVLTLWLLLRKRKYTRTPTQSSQQNLTMEIINTTLPFPPVSLVPGSPGSSQVRNNSIHSPFSLADLVFQEPELSKYSPSMNNPYRRNSPPFRYQSMTPNDTGNGAHQTMPQSTGIPVSSLA